MTDFNSGCVKLTFWSDFSFVKTFCFDAHALMPSKL